MMRNPAVKYLPLLLSGVLFVALSHYFFGQIGDDSFIYFRYVDRALAGQWWSWSDHIAPVEGYSSPLWYLLLIVAGKLGVAVDTAARSLGLLFAALTVAGCWRLCRLLDVSVLLSGMACLLLVLNQGFHYWSSAGLETSLYMALLVGSCIGIVRGYGWLLPTALLGVARPEGPFLLLALTIALLLFRRPLLSPLRVFFLWLPTLLWLLLRLSVYGEWLPNTFYAKATGSTIQQLIKGVIYCLPVLLPLLLMWGLWLFGKTRPQRDALLVVLGMISLLTGIVLLGGGDWMFHFRLWLPVLALLWAALACYWSQSHWMMRAAIAGSCLLLVLLSVPPAVLGAAFTGKTLPLDGFQEGNMTHQSLHLAADIQQHYPAAKRVAVNHAGALPWALPTMDMIDMVGLNDAHIARVQGELHKKYDADYVLSLEPDLVVLNTRVKPGTDGIWYHPGYWVGETALYQHPDFLRDYQPTALVYEWQWQIPFPYSLLVPSSTINSWIVVYQRIGDISPAR